MADVNALWEAPYKPNGALAEDGDYFGVVGDADVKIVRNGEVELLEIPITVSEGGCAGEEIKASIFYQKEVGMNILKGLMDKVDEKIRANSPSLEVALVSLCAMLTGRTVKFRQKTTSSSTFYNILEVYESDAHPMVDDVQEDDIPF